MLERIIKSIGLSVLSVGLFTNSAYGKKESSIPKTGYELSDKLIGEDDISKKLGEVREYNTKYLNLLVDFGELAKKYDKKERNDEGSGYVEQVRKIRFQYLMINSNFFYKILSSLSKLDPILNEKVNYFDVRRVEINKEYKKTGDLVMLLAELQEFNSDIIEETLNAYSRLKGRIPDENKEIAMRKIEGFLNDLKGFLKNDEEFYINFKTRYEGK